MCLKVNDAGLWIELRGNVRGMSAMDVDANNVAGAAAGRVRLYTCRWVTLWRNDGRSIAIGTADRDVRDAAVMAESGTARVLADTLRRTVPSHAVAPKFLQGQPRMMFPFLTKPLLLLAPLPCPANLVTVA